MDALIDRSIDRLNVRWMDELIESVGLIERLKDGLIDRYMVHIRFTKDQ